MLFKDLWWWLYDFFQMFVFFFEFLVFFLQEKIYVKKDSRVPSPEGPWHWSWHNQASAPPYHHLGAPPVKRRANGHRRIFFGYVFLGQIGVVRYDMYIYAIICIYLYLYLWYIRNYMYYHHNELLCSAFATRKQHTWNFEWNMWKKQLLGGYGYRSGCWSHKGSAQHG